MNIKRFIKLASFLLIFAVGFFTLQSCKDKKNDKQTTEVKAEASDMKCEAGKCGEGKCGEGKVAKDSTATEEGKCGEGKVANDSTATEEGKCGEGKCGEGKCG